MFFTKKIFYQILISIQNYTIESHPFQRTKKSSFRAMYAYKNELNTGIPIVIVNFLPWQVHTRLKYQVCPCDESLATSLILSHFPHLF